MKIKKYLKSSAVALFLALFLQSCYYTPVSVYPFYKDRDLTFDRELLGDWAGKNDNERVNIIVKEGTQEKEYYLIYFTGGKSLVYVAHLFDFHDSTYLDLTPSNKNPKDPGKDEAYLLLAHGLWKVVRIKDKLSLYAMDQNAL